MDITYYGHSCFKLKGRDGTVVTDPYDPYVGFTLPSLTADIVTVSHDHPDHNGVKAVKGTARREKPFIINKPGEYEVGGISVFGVPTWHDDHQGAERGQNSVYTILIDDLTVCHLGDLGHELTADQISEIGSIDILLCPVGGVFTIDPEAAITVIHSLEPSIVIPMHYKTDEHEASVFSELKTLKDFAQIYGMDPTPEGKFSVEKNQLPEETELVFLSKM